MAFLSYLLSFLNFVPVSSKSAFISRIITLWDGHFRLFRQRLHSPVLAPLSRTSNAGRGQPAWQTFEKEGKGSFGREEGGREGGRERVRGKVRLGFPPSSSVLRVSLTPKTPFPFPFKRLPRRLGRGEPSLPALRDIERGARIWLRPPLVLFFPVCSWFSVHSSTGPRGTTTQSCSGPCCFLLSLLGIFLQYLIRCPLATLKMNAVLPYFYTRLDSFPLLQRVIYMYHIHSLFL